LKIDEKEEKYGRRLPNVAKKMTP